MEPILATEFDPLEYELPPGYRPRKCAQIWRAPLPKWSQRLEATIAKLPSSRTPGVFFRADDIGAGGRAFNALCKLFREYQVPLAMAVVPGWLSQIRVKKLFRQAPAEEMLWGWHQHGWRHVNWQRTGARSEFGKERPYEKQWQDIWRGQQKMREIFGDHLLPVFTPPWNHLSRSTLKILHELGFRAVSLTEPLPSRIAKSNPELKNLRIHVDLHTRKSRDVLTDFENLLEELYFSLIKYDFVGVVIHHQRMTLFAFEFLKKLIELLKFEVGTTFLTFRELMEM